jgi:signal transduction histidine kinase
MKMEIENKAIQVDVKLDPDLAPVMADKKEMNQVFFNLIVNAIKYNKDNGVIRVKGGMQNHMARIVIEDTGIGMDQEELSRCFDEFYRARNKKTRNIAGTGLGLSIVNRIVNSYAGRLEVASKKDKGTQFTIYFPIAQDI